MKSLITSELQILVRGEMSVRCSPRRCGSPVHVDVATDGFFAWSYGEDISVTALKRRESACMFYSSPRKTHPSRLQRMRPFRPPRPCGERPWWFVMMTTASVVQSSSEASGARHRTSTRRRWSPEQRRDGHRARGDPAYAWPPTCRGSA